MILLSKLRKLFTKLPRSKNNIYDDNRQPSKCDACDSVTYQFVVFLIYNTTTICLKCYEEDKWLAKVKRKEAITNGGF